MYVDSCQTQQATIPPRLAQGGVALALTPGQAYVEFQPGTTPDAITRIVGKLDLASVQAPSTRLPVRPLADVLPQVTVVRSPNESTDSLLRRLLAQPEVRLASPIYHRPDLDRPTAFTFQETLLVRFRDHGGCLPEDSFPEGFLLEDVSGPFPMLGGRLRRFKVLRANGRTATAEDIFCVAQALRRHLVLESVRPDWLQLTPATNAGSIDPSPSKVGNQKLINWSPGLALRNGEAVIAILDTGCDLGHKQLKPRLVDRALWCDAVTGGRNPGDVDGHGTCCAGIAAGAWDLTVGVGGIAPTCRIMPIRVMQSAFIQESHMVAGLDWALAHGAHVASMSWHYEGPHDNFNASLVHAHDAGAVLVAAAGNVEHLNAVDYPASHPLVLAVGASDGCGQRHTQDSPDRENWGSQYGAELGVMAPGSECWATDITGSGGYVTDGGTEYKVTGVTYKPSGTRDGNFFACFGGTSGAAPQVAGLAGLLRSQNPALTADNNRNLIESTCQKTGGYTYQAGLSGHSSGTWHYEMGYGVIDVGAALAHAQRTAPIV